VIERLDAAISEGLKSPEVRAGFARLGVAENIGNARQFAALIADELPRWAELIKLTGARLD
jgi:tripartite-type tricarboxylate transporter receptor subunit TctC